MANLGYTLMYVKYFSTKGDVTQSPFLVKLDITKLKRYLLGDHPLKTSAFLGGRHCAFNGVLRCSSEIKVWGHLCQILVVFEVPAQPQVKGMSGNS